ncbi:MAG: zf-HC2 domain-containing protein [Gammaproteobacteria bacterium]|nr:zf-HC2 domain-containing protein [Gammaproteobacteria bacterium]
MNCSAVDRLVDDYLDGALTPDEVATLEHHATECPSCRTLLASERDLRQALRDLPVPAPSEAFFDRAIAQAVTRNHRQYRRMPGLGLALAASVMMVFAVGILYKSGPAPVQDIPGLAIALNQHQDVSLVLESEQSMEKARFTIRLPEGIEVSGYPGQRELSWEGSLAQGKNLLVLPVEAHSGRGGDLVAVVTHTGKRKNFVLRMDVLSPQETPITNHQNQNAATITVM